MTFYHRRQRYYMTREAYKAKKRADRLRMMGFASEADYQSAKLAARLSKGTYNHDYTISTSEYIGSTQTTVRDSEFVTRTYVNGDHKGIFPYHLVKYKSSGSSFVGIKAHYVNQWNNIYLNLCRQKDDTDAAWWGGYDVTGPRRSDLISRSQSALLSKIRSDMPTWDILTDAVELRETISSLKGAATWTANLLKHVSRRDVAGIIKHLRLNETRRTRKRVKACVLIPGSAGQAMRYRYYVQDYRPPVRVIDAMSNLWMSYRYSFMTTIYSIEDAMIALAAPKRSKDYENSAQVTLRDDYSSSKASWSPSYGRAYASFQFGSILRISGSIRKHALYSFYESLEDRLNPNTILSFVKTAWEVVPYSWVADWALGISDYLSLLELDSLLCKSQVSVTEKGNVYKSDYFMGVRTGDDVPIKDYTITKAPSQGVFTSTSFYFDRSLGSVSVPQWAPAETWYNWRRGLDGSSLAWNQVKKKLLRAIN